MALPPSAPASGFAWAAAPAEAQCAAGKPPPPGQLLMKGTAGPAGEAWRGCSAG